MDDQIIAGQSLKCILREHDDPLVPSMMTLKAEKIITRTLVVKQALINLIKFIKTTRFYCMTMVFKLYAAIHFFHLSTSSQTHGSVLNIITAVEKSLNL